jgi:hypothetical protein
MISAGDGLSPGTSMPMRLQRPLKDASSEAGFVSVSVVVEFIGRPLFSQPGATRRPRKRTEGRRPFFWEGFKVEGYQVIRLTCGLVPPA